MATQMYTALDKQALTTRVVEAQELANLLTVAELMGIAPAGPPGNVGFAASEETVLAEGYAAFKELSLRLLES